MVEKTNNKPILQKQKSTMFRDMHTFDNEQGANASSFSFEAFQPDQSTMGSSSLGGLNLTGIVNAVEEQDSFDYSEDDFVRASDNQEKKSKFEIFNEQFVTLNNAQYTFYTAVLTVILAFIWSTGSSVVEYGKGKAKSFISNKPSPTPQAVTPRNNHRQHEISKPQDKNPQQIDKLKSLDDWEKKALDAFYKPIADPEA